MDVPPKAASYFFQADRDVMRDVLRRWMTPNPFTSEAHAAGIVSLCGMLVVMLLVLGSVPAAAQTPDDLPLTKLEEAFRAGSVDGLMGRAADRLEMAVLSSGMLYSRGQAVYVMGKFFREHPPQSFSIEQVTKADDSWFAMGSYQAQGEERRYRVYLRLQRSSEAWALIEIRISSGGGP